MCSIQQTWDLKLYKIWVQKPGTGFVIAMTSMLQHYVWWCTTISKWCILDVSAGPDLPFRGSLCLSVSYGVLQTLQLHLVRLQCLIIILNDSRFPQDFIWYSKLFQTLGPKTLKLLLRKVIWLCTVIFKFNIFFSQISLLVSLNLKRSLINSGLRLLIVL